MRQLRLASNLESLRDRKVKELIKTTESINNIAEELSTDLQEVSSPEILFIKLDPEKEEEDYKELLDAAQTLKRDIQSLLKTTTSFVRLYEDLNTLESELIDLDQEIYRKTRRLEAPEREYESSQPKEELREEVSDLLFSRR